MKAIAASFIFIYHLVFKGTLGEEYIVLMCMQESGERDSGLSVVTIVAVADLPMMLDQIVDSCHSLVLSGLREDPVTLWCSLLLWGHVRTPQIILSSVA